MNLVDFKNALNSNSTLPIRFRLPDGALVPKHFHVTEVGRIQKDFIDCGGTKRSLTTCLLQTWVANDTDHQLISSKLIGILKMAESILLTDELEVEVEYEDSLISQFQVSQFVVKDGFLEFQLATKHTDCLAKDKCMIENSTGSTESQCCSGSDCC